MLAWGETWCGWEAWKSLFETVDFHTGDEADTFFQTFATDSVTSEKFVVISAGASRNVFHFVKHLRISFDGGAYMNQLQQFRLYFSLFLSRSALESITFNINEWGNCGDFMVFTSDPYPSSLKLVQIVSNGEPVGIFSNKILPKMFTFLPGGSCRPKDPALVIGRLEYANLQVSTGGRTPHFPPRGPALCWVRWDLQPYVISEHYDLFWCSEYCFWWTFFAPLWWCFVLFLSQNMQE